MKRFGAGKGILGSPNGLALSSRKRPGPNTYKLKNGAYNH